MIDPNGKERTRFSFHALTQAPGELMAGEKCVPAFFNETVSLRAERPLIIRRRRFKKFSDHQSALSAACRNSRYRPLSIPRKYPKRPCRLRGGHCPYV